MRSTLSSKITRRSSFVRTCRRAVSSYVQDDVTGAAGPYGSAVKRCKVCGETKPLDQFYKAAGMADGHRSDCIPCNLAAKHAQIARDPEKHRARARRWQSVNPERYAATQRAYRDSGRKR